MKRRTIIKGLAAMAPLAGMGRLHAVEESLQSSPEVGACRLISQDIMGPFAIPDPPERSNLVMGQPGVPLRLRFHVVNAFSCQPLPNARVSIWHSNADGLYSAVENIILDARGLPTGEKVDRRSVDWLRGVQRTDGEGRCEFQTIVPGWYYPRPVHLHLSVFPEGNGELATTQLYSPDEVCDKVFEAPAYAARGANPARTTPGAESAIDGTDEGDLWLKLRPEGDGLVAEHQVGVTYYGDMFGELPDMYRT